MTWVVGPGYFISALQAFDSKPTRVSGWVNHSTMDWPMDPSAETDGTDSISLVLRRRGLALSHEHFAATTWIAVRSQTHSPLVKNFACNPLELLLESPPLQLSKASVSLSGEIQQRKSTGICTPGFPNFERLIISRPRSGEVARPQREGSERRENEPSVQGRATARLHPCRRFSME